MHGEEMIAPDGDADFARVRELLAGHNTLTLATAGEGGAWAATVFYASDEALQSLLRIRPEDPSRA
jgi:uncharacterized protein YhbP (UPF0306 family)